MNQAKTVDTPTPTTKPILARLLRRNAHRVQVLGALIVFTTFLAKEALREHYKDRNEEMVTARNLFISRADIGNLSIRLRTIEGRVSKLDPEPDQQLLNDSRTAVQELRLGISASVDAMTELQSHLPSTMETETDWQNLRQELTQLDKASESVQNLSAVSVTNVKQRLNVLDKVFAARAAAVYCQFRCNRLNAELLKLANQEVQKSERRYNTSTYFSLLAYALGWGLSFIGTFYNVELIKVSE
jgi:hypothetical protein